MILHQVVVLLDNVGHLGRGQAVSQYLSLCLDLLHKVAVFTDNLTDLALQVSPYLLLVLDDVLGLVQLVLQVVDLLLQFLHLVILILLEVSKHLLEDKDLGLVIVALLDQVVYLLLHGFFPFLVHLESCLHLQVLVAIICCSILGVLLAVYLGHALGIVRLSERQKLLVQSKVHGQILYLLFQLVVLLSVVVQLRCLFQSQELLVLSVICEESIVCPRENRLTLLFFCVSLSFLLISSFLW